MIYKIEYWVGSKKVETYYQQTKALANYLVKQKKESGAYTLGTWKIIEQK